MNTEESSARFPADPPQDPETRRKRKESSLLSRFFATGFLVGYLPWASGTLGTLVGLALYMIPGAESPVILGSLIAGGFVIGVYTSGIVARAEGHRLSPLAQSAKAAFQPSGHANPDPSIVVIDEIVGMWVSLLWLPKVPLAFVAAFVLFRAFDVVKPEPARILERLRGGWGIMLDDVVAGIYACLCSHALLAAARWIFPGFF